MNKTFDINLISMNGKSYISSQDVLKLLSIIETDSDLKAATKACKKGLLDAMRLTKENK